MFYRILWGIRGASTVLRGVSRGVLSFLGHFREPQTIEEVSGTFQWRIRKSQGVSGTNQKFQRDLGGSRGVSGRISECFMDVSERSDGRLEKYVILHLEYLPNHVSEGLREVSGSLRRIQGHSETHSQRVSGTFQEF